MTLIVKEKETSSNVDYGLLQYAYGINIIIRGTTLVHLY